MIERVRLTEGGEPVRLIALPAYSQKALDAWNRFVDSESIFGLDVESDTGEDLGTYSETVKMRLIQFGSHTEAWTLDPTHPKWRQRIIDFLHHSGKRFVSHNDPFDTTRVHFEFGITLGDRSIDTLTMASLCWPGITKRKGLKQLTSEFITPLLEECDVLRAARFTDLYYAAKPRKTRLLPLNFEPGVSPCRKAKCDVPSWPGSLCGYCEHHWKHRTHNRTSEAWGWKHIALDDPYYVRYAGLDAICVRILLDLLDTEVKRRKMPRLCRRELRIRRYMTAVSVKGHRVDAEWTKPILDEFEETYGNAQARVLDLTGCKAASPYLKEWLGKQGLRVTSLDKDHLPDLLDDFGDEPEVGPVLRELTTISEHKNILTNLRIIWDHATKGDGFTHANIKTMQAHTGRMSATEPAMQTFKKDDPRLRGCYIAREGHTLVGADYDSQEIRIAAALSRDEALLKVVFEGLNQHVLTAEGIFPDFLSKAESHDQYDLAKKLDFTIQYGAMPKKIAATLGISPREATILWQKWRQTYATYVRWLDEQAKLRHVRNPYGRLIPRDPFRDFANGNYLIQSTGRDVLGEALDNLAGAGWAPYFWLPVHDEMILEVPEDREDEAAAALTEHMATEIRGVPITATGEIIGKRWRGLG